MESNYSYLSILLLIKYSTLEMLDSVLQWPYACTPLEKETKFFWAILNCKIAMMRLPLLVSFLLSTLLFLHQIIIRYSIIYIEGNYTNLNC